MFGGAVSSSRSCRSGIAYFKGANQRIATEMARPTSAAAPSHRDAVSCRYDFAKSPSSRMSRLSAPSGIGSNLLGRACSCGHKDCRSGERQGNTYHNPIGQLPHWRECANAITSAYDGQRPTIQSALLEWLATAGRLGGRWAALPESPLRPIDLPAAVQERCQRALLSRHESEHRPPPRSP